MLRHVHSGQKKSPRKITRLPFSLCTLFICRLVLAHCLLSERSCHFDLRADSAIVFIDLGVDPVTEHTDGRGVQARGRWLQSASSRWGLSTRQVYDTAHLANI